MIPKMTIVSRNPNLTDKDLEEMNAQSEWFVFVKEGSGECQSRSNVPDSAGATPAPSTNCQCGGRTFATVKGVAMCESCFEDAKYSEDRANPTCKPALQVAQKPEKPCWNCGEPIAEGSFCGCAPETSSCYEQKPVCMCCTSFANWTEIYHDDPCQHTHLERYMLPVARAQFRARQLEREKAYDAVIDRKRDLETLAKIESDRGGNHMTPTQEKMYVQLTGHDFKAE